MNRLSVAAILCVRMSSERLPGKPLVSYSPDGKTNLDIIVERVLTSRHSVRLVIATSTDSSDSVIVHHARTRGYPVYRGSLDNVMARFDGALNEHAKDAEYIWRVMGDCPLVDVGLTDWRLDVLHRNQADVMTILQPEPTYAAQASVWSREAWDKCARLSSGSLLQHPGEFIYESLGNFKTLHEVGPENVYYQDIRTELDTPEDLKFFKRVWKEYPPSLPFEDVNIEARSITYFDGDKSYDTKPVLTWLSSRPDIVAINQHIEMRTKSTHLHGHHRARNFVCEACRERGVKTILATKINDALELQCPTCGTPRRFYV